MFYFDTMFSAVFTLVYNSARYINNKIFCCCFRNYASLRVFSMGDVSGDHFCSQPITIK